MIKPIIISYALSTCLISQPLFADAVERHPDKIIDAVCAPPHNEHENSRYDKIMQLLETASPSNRKLRGKIRKAGGYFREQAGHLSRESRVRYVRDNWTMRLTQNPDTDNVVMTNRNGEAIDSLKVDPYSQTLTVQLHQSLALFEKAFAYRLSYDRNPEERIYLNTYTYLLEEYKKHTEEKDMFSVSFYICLPFKRI